MSYIIPWIYPKTISELKRFILQKGKKISYKRNELLVNAAGGTPKTFYLLSGQAMLSYSNAEGKLLGASLILPGSTLGEFTLLTDSIKIFDIITLSRTEFIGINTSLLKEKTESNIDFKLSLFDHIIARQYSAILGFIYNNIHPIKFRLMALLMGLAKYNNEEIIDSEWGEIPKVSQENLARIINTSRNTLNITLMELVDEGVTKLHNNTVYIKFDSTFIVKPVVKFDMKKSAFN